MLKAKIKRMVSGGIRMVSVCEFVALEFENFLNFRKRNFRYETLENSNRNIGWVTFDHVKYVVIGIQKCCVVGNPNLLDNAPNSPGGDKSKEVNTGTKGVNVVFLCYAFDLLARAIYSLYVRQMFSNQRQGQNFPNNSVGGAGNEGQPGRNINKKFFFFLN